MASINVPVTAAVGYELLEPTAKPREESQVGEILSSVDRSARPEQAKLSFGCGDS